MNPIQTAINEQGKSQGDRLLEKKAKMQTKQGASNGYHYKKNGEQSDSNQPCASSTTTPIKHLKLSLITRCNQPRTYSSKVDPERSKSSTITGTPVSI